MWNQLWMAKPTFKRATKTKHQKLEKPNFIAWMTLQSKKWGYGLTVDFTWSKKLFFGVMRLQLPSLSIQVIVSTCCKQSSAANKMLVGPTLLQRTYLISGNPLSHLTNLLCQWEAHFIDENLLSQSRSPLYRWKAHFICWEAYFIIKKHTFSIEKVG